MMAIKSSPESFNPTLVRLRQPCGLEGIPQGRKFQSHAGSIEAKMLTLSMNGVI